MLNIIINILLKVIPVAYQIYKQYHTQDIHIGVTSTKRELDKLPIEQVIKIGTKK